ncbi:DUF1735 domain-containing protein [Chitinophaga silvatica]|uniref:DUF1735 domain-containing protein n=1 Tax=Chitinophaga silvatica TaxID=2282649 RepID=A0A3E1YFY5_9BACT|nr:discoidin domain-containing protein [Chitinophaga silvatica]RFS26313.1 DUF1735 domain-containing protein [Chitinophaga silvatica]
MSINQLYIICLLFTCTILNACKDKYELPDQPLSAYNKVYIPQGVNGIKAYTLKIADTAQTILYSANYGGVEYPGADIQVNFAVNNQLVDSINNINNTSYAVMPDESYEFVTSAVIKQGTLGTGALALKIKTSGENAPQMLKDYLLPIVISSSSGEINKALSVTFFKITIQPEMYDRTNWTIAGFSSEEASGEGPKNGKAIFVLDNDPSSFWHTQWLGASPGPPHYLIIDMGETKTIHGLALTPRQSDNSGKPEELALETSMDNVTWQQAGEFTMTNSKDEQLKVMNSYNQARYFKVIIKKSYSATYTHLAELKAF